MVYELFISDIISSGLSKAQLCGKKLFLKLKVFCDTYRVVCVMLQYDFCDIYDNV